MEPSGEALAAASSAGELGGGAGGQPHVLIVGAGFGGLACARALAGAPVRVTILDQRNHHTFTPFLYQLATALLEPAEVVQPVRQLLRHVGNAQFRLGRMTAVDLERRQVHTNCGELRYDYLVLAAGAVNNYFGNREIAERSFGLGDLFEAERLRDRILLACERAAWTSDPRERGRLLRFAVVGGGATGVELAGALSELIHRVLSRDYPELDMDAAEIALIEASDAPLAGYAPRLQRAAQRALERKRVQVISATRAQRLDEQGLHLDGGRTLDAGTVIWAAGVRAAPAAQQLAAALAEAGSRGPGQHATSDLRDSQGPDGALGSHGRLRVSRTLQLPGHPEVLAIGDVAEIPGADGKPLPMLAQVAIQSGRHAAAVIAALLTGQQPSPFRYRDLGTMATQGRNAAVAQIGPLKLSGFLGWLAWLLVHIARTVGVRTRVLVAVNWIAGYLLIDRPVRLITGVIEPDVDGERGRANERMRSRSQRGGN